MNIRPVFNESDQRKLSIISFSLFSAWLLSFPFEGQVLYALDKKQTLMKQLWFSQLSVLHFVGLIITGFCVKRQDAAKVTMIASSVACLAGSLVFFLPPILLCGISPLPPWLCLPVYS